MLQMLKGDLLIFVALFLLYAVLKVKAPRLFIADQIQIYLPPEEDTPRTAKELKSEPGQLCPLLNRKIYSAPHVFEGAYFLSEYDIILQSAAISFLLAISTLCAVRLGLVAQGPNFFFYYLAFGLLASVYFGAKVLKLRGLVSYESKISFVLAGGLSSLITALHLGGKGLFNGSLLNSLEEWQYHRSTLANQVLVVNPINVLLCLNFVVFVLVLVSTLSFVKFANNYVSALQQSRPRASISDPSPQPTNSETKRVLQQYKTELGMNAALLLASSDGLLGQLLIQPTQQMMILRGILLVVNIAFTIRGRTASLCFQHQQGKLALLEYQAKPSQANLNKAKKITVSNLRSFVLANFQLLLPALIPVLLLALSISSWFYAPSDAHFRAHCDVLTDRVEFYQRSNLCARAGGAGGFGVEQGYWQEEQGKGALWGLTKGGFLTQGLLRQGCSFVLFNYYLCKFVLQSGLIIFIRNSIDL